MVGRLSRHIRARVLEGLILSSDKASGAFDWLLLTYSYVLWCRAQVELRVRDRQCGKHVLRILIKVNRGFRHLGSHVILGLSLELLVRLVLVAGDFIRLLSRIRQEHLSFLFRSDACHNLVRCKHLVLLRRSNDLLELD